MKGGNELSKGEKWALINKLLNTLRKAKGLPLVSPNDNPYYFKQEVKKSA